MQVDAAPLERQVEAPGVIEVPYAHVQRTSLLGADQSTIVMESVDIVQAGLAQP
jgi:hypothetical protein